MKKSYIKGLFAAVCFLSAATITYSQEEIGSYSEQYFQYYALQGTVEKPYLNYRTLSDSRCLFPACAQYIWDASCLPSMRAIGGGFSLRLYGPDLFMSYNTERPYGQNDGAFWQGRGFNTRLRTGLRLEGYGIELTVKPELSFSQNLFYERMESSVGDGFGYFWGNIDSPQRFGDEAFWTFDWGDTEIRYTWKTLTLGFGTQSIWLGPAQINGIIHSNNATPYPKADFGLRRQPVTLLGWYAGDIEARIWTGRLEESDYFDDDETNDYSMINALTVSYAPSFLRGLTLGAARVFVTKWDWSNLSYLGRLFWFDKTNAQEDQKAAVFASWQFPSSGLEIYGEAVIDDFVPGSTGYIRYPFHTLMYTTGLKKHIPISPAKQVYGELLAEVSMLEMSQDFQFQWGYSLYHHSPLTHGYTNRGQILGAGSGEGGNSQYLGFTVYYPKGKSTLYVHRENPDNNYLYSKAVYAEAGDVTAADSLEKKYFTNWNANLAVGLTTQWFAAKHLSLTGGIVYQLVLNPLYENISFGKDVMVHNFSIQAGVSYVF